LFDANSKKKCLMLLKNRIGIINDKLALTNWLNGIYNTNADSIGFDIAGASATVLKGGDLVTSLVEQAILLMIAGVVTPTGRRTASALLTVALVLAEMPSVAVMVASMLLLILVTMTL
jgi:hypothetical protein